jgi:hypothetical protein
MCVGSDALNTLGPDRFRLCGEMIRSETLVDVSSIRIKNINAETAFDNIDAEYEALCAEYNAVAA